MHQETIPFDASLPTVTLTTDGACNPNPGCGGWAYVLRFGSAYKEASGGDRETTNNRMEMIAVIEGLKALKRPCSVVVRTDSEINRHILNRTGKKPHKRANQDLVNEMLRQMEIHTIRAIWIRGHSGDADNERCDELAVYARTQLNAP